MNGRRARLQILYNNIDISEDLLPHLKNWSYTDNLSGQADDLQITLEDRDELWSGDWMPDTGANLTAKIIRENWLNDGETKELLLGQFEFDELETGKPPSVVTIKAISIPESKSLRGEEKTRAWEKTRLSLVSRDIANKAGMQIFYDTDDDPEYDRIEQSGETDLVFLMRLCTDGGLCLKVSDAQIIIFDERKYESQEPVLTIQKGETDIKNRSGRKTMTGIYRSCKVEYHDTDKKTTIRHTFTPPNPPKTSRVLVINERVVSTRDAEKLAKKRLRQENKNEITYSLALMGDLRFMAGLTVNLQGFGKFDGKYIITQVTHGQQSAYETKLQLRKCLEGY